MTSAAEQNSSVFADRFGNRAAGPVVNSREPVKISSIRPVILTISRWARIDLIQGSYSTGVVEDVPNKPGSWDEGGDFSGASSASSNRIGV
jgi:hypothetical protein